MTRIQQLEALRIARLRGARDGAVYIRTRAENLRRAARARS